MPGFEMISGSSPCNYYRHRLGALTIKMHWKSSTLNDFSIHDYVELETGIRELRQTMNGVFYSYFNSFSMIQM